MTTMLVAIAVMTAVAMALLLLPMLRSGDRAEAAAFDVAVYNDQLRELERDLERGVIDADEAQTARLEIERRILKASKRDPGPATQRTRQGIVAGAAAAIAVLVVAMSLYAWLGSPELPGAPFAARQAPEPAPADASHEIATMVERLRQRLAESPDDLEGWLMLARSELTLDRPRAAVEAYRHAEALAPEEARIKAALGETLVMAAGGLVTPEADGKFSEALAIEPDLPQALYYLGIGSAQAGRYQEAYDAWLGMLERGPPDAPWRPQVETNLRAAAEQIGVNADEVLAALPRPTAPEPSVAARGPTADDMAAAAQMSADDRAEMIRGMVDRLAARLEENPDDLEGWLRLAQARTVLDEPAAAREAYGRALDLMEPGHPERAAVQQRLDALPN